jgi:threonyl-tRNA synthetase
MDKAKLEMMRHSTAHVLAAAVLKIFPNVKFGIGPAVENGFYYDFELDKPLTVADLPKIEAKMRDIIKENLPFEKQEMSRDEAIAMFDHFKQTYKVELLREGTVGEDGKMEKIGDKVTVYKTGRFSDLCRGPHIASTKEIGAFKLTSVAGAYWRGDEKRPMLQRVYGVAFEKQSEIDEYIKMLEEAEKRDHRKLGKDMELFMISEEVGKGLPLWLPNGAFIRRKLEDYMYEKEMKKNYKHVYTPVLTHKKLYETSGHLAHYHEDMYSPVDIEGEEYYLKPMNCPHHHMIYKNKNLSYRDLPLRLAEFGLCHRFERSGVLTGLIRARCFTQNDAHIYCAKEDLKKELLGVLDLFRKVYADFGIKDYWYRLSLPDFNNKEKYGDVEDKETWTKAGKAIEEALKEFGVKYVVGVGEATFYGPKIDVQIKNVLGKEDSIATAQVDFYSAGKFNLEFTNEKGQKEKPVIIHRAIMGSFERFFSFLVEQTAGAFPTWLAPVQVDIIPVGKRHVKPSFKLAKMLEKEGLRVHVDDFNETVGYKIRKAEKQKAPYMLVIGDKEMGGKKLNVRVRGKQKTMIMTVKKFIEKIREEIEKRK